MNVAQIFVVVISFCLRYKEHEVEQDEPVCEMVIEKKCKQVTSKFTLSVDTRM